MPNGYHPSDQSDAPDHHDPPQSDSIAIVDDDDNGGVVSGEDAGGGGGHRECEADGEVAISGVGVANQSSRGGCDANREASDSTGKPEMRELDEWVPLQEACQKWDVWRQRKEELEWKCKRDLKRYMDTLDEHRAHMMTEPPLNLQELIDEGVRLGEERAYMCGAQNRCRGAETGSG